MQKKPLRASTRRFWTRPSIPPASPHRAGHYSGLHPEDQPYQSSLIAIPPSLRHEPTTEEDEEVWRHPPHQEPEHIVLPTTHAHQNIELYRHFAPTVYVDNAEAYTQRARTPLKRRVIPVLLTLSCLFFLLATGIITFVLTAKHPTLASPVFTASPNTLRTSDTCLLTGSGFAANSLMTFTYNQGHPILDNNQQVLLAHTDATGAFTLQWLIPDSWMPGTYTIRATDESQKLNITTIITIRPDALATLPPALQLSDTSLDLGTDQVGTISRQLTTLTNAGGGQVTWQASSDMPWLTVSPGSATFSGSQAITVTVNRATLPPQAYLGHITFKQKDGTTALQLTVTMKVVPAPASFGVSTAALTFAASTSQNPDDQTIVVQNSGGQALVWNSTIATGNGITWLSTTPQAGRLDPGNSTTITVHAQSSQLTIGTYAGFISFTGDAHAQVNVSLNVIAPGNLVVSPPDLSFSTLTGQNPASKSITLQNSGGMALDWTLTTAVDGGNWLSASPLAGTLDANGQATATITITSSALQAGSYQGQLTFNNGNTSKQVAVDLTVTNTPSAAINLQTSSLNFLTTVGADPTAQTFLITNTGNAPLNWTATEDGNGATFAPVTPAKGTLASGASTTLTVSPSVAALPASTLQTIITLADSDPGTTVTSQQVAVTITIQAHAAPKTQQRTLSIAALSTYPSVDQRNITSPELLAARQRLALAVSQQMRNG